MSIANELIKTFYGKGGPPGYFSLVADNGYDDVRIIKQGDRWINTDNMDNFFYKDTSWNRISTQDNNDLTYLYKNYIGAIVQTVASEPTNPSGVTKGTGFFISDDGYFVTAFHIYLGERTAGVISTVDLSVVVFPENVLIKAVLIGIDSRTEFALFKIDLNDPSLSEPLGKRTFLNIVDSFNLKPGTQVVCLGHPGLGNQAQSICVGNIFINNSNGQSTTGSIVTSVNTSEGNSGGPLMTLNGEAIGFVSSSDNFSVNFSSEQIHNFSSTNSFIPVLNKFLYNHRNFNTIQQVYSPGFLGIIPFDLTTRIAAKYYKDNNTFLPFPIEGIFLGNTAGNFRKTLIPTTLSDYAIPFSTFPYGTATVQDVFNGSPAQNAGLIPGIDIIMSAAISGQTLLPVGNNNKISNLASLVHLAGPTGSIDITYRRKTDVPPYSIIHSVNNIGLTGYPANIWPYFSNLVI